MEKAASGVLPELSAKRNVASSANVDSSAKLPVSESPSGAMAIDLPPAVVLTTSRRRVFARETPLEAISCRTHSASSNSMDLGIRLKMYCLTGVVINSLNKSDRVDFFGVELPFFIVREMKRWEP